MGLVPDLTSITKSISHSGGNLGKSTGNTSENSQTIGTNSIVGASAVTSQTWAKSAEQPVDISI